MSVSRFEEVGRGSFLFLLKFGLNEAEGEGVCTCSGASPGTIRQEGRELANPPVASATPSLCTEFISQDVACDRQMERKGA